MYFSQQEIIVLVPVGLLSLLSHHTKAVVKAMNILILVVDANQLTFHFLYLPTASCNVPTTLTLFGAKLCTPTTSMILIVI